MYAPIPALGALPWVPEREHVSTASHQRKRVSVKVPTLLLFSRRCRNYQWSVGVNGCLQKVLMEDCVPLISLELLGRNMTEHILMILLTLHEVRSDYALTWVCGRTITGMLLRLRTAMVLAFSLTTLEEHI